MSGEPLVEIRDLKVYFGVRGRRMLQKAVGYVRAVDEVTLTVHRGETLGLVGESGSGKTTLGRAVLRALPVTAGEVRFHVDGEAVDVLALRGDRLRRFRRHMQLIFQDPYASLDPRMTVRDIIAEPLEAPRHLRNKREIDERVREIAARCRLNVEFLRRFPHAFSGGQRQRIGIARALVANPEFVVCDEAVSALDVSIQADILNLLMDLQQELGTTYLFITHDLSVVAQISDRVAVLYLGRLMELGPTAEIFARPKHPYTRALLSAIPRVEPEHRFDPVKLRGEIPDPAHPPQGCRFSTRCPFVRDRCREEDPAFREIARDHFAACHFAEELAG